MAKGRAKGKGGAATATTTEASQVVEDFDQVLKEFVAKDPGLQTSTTNQLLYFIIAVVVCLVPMRLFLTPSYDLSLTEHGVVLAVITVVASYLIMKAYVETATRTEARLAKSNSAPTPRGKKGSEAAEADPRKKVANEAFMYSLFINNFIFTFLFSLTAFLVMPWAEETFVGTVEENESGVRMFKLITYATSLLGSSFVLVSIS